MKPRHLAAVLLFACLPATFSRPAWSQDDATTLQARARFKEGVDAFDKGKYEEARLAFLQAYTLKKHPAVLLNLAQSSAKSNHPLEAAKYFQQFLKEATSATPQQRKDAESGLNEVRQKLGRIEVVAPAGTDISLDEQGKVGTTPMEPIDVEPGQHTVKSPTQSVTVIATVGQKVEAKLGQTPAPVVAPTPAPPPAAPVEPAPAPIEPPAADTGPTKTETNLFSPPATMAPVYVGLGVAAVGGISAIVFALFKADANTKYEDVSNNIRSTAVSRGKNPIGICNDPNSPEFGEACKTARDNADKVDTNATIANVSLIVGGAGLLFAGAWYLAAPKRDDSKPASSGERKPSRPVLMPYAGVRGSGLTLSGEF